MDSVLDAAAPLANPLPGACQRHLREQAEFSKISTYTLWKVLHEAGWSWQSSRSWCQTGQVKRRRKSGIVEVTDPDSQAKKT